MSTSTPHLLMKSNREVLTANGSAAKDGATKAGKSKAPVEGEKLVIRRLPPGMTSAEFLAILGDEWHVGNGKVDWYDFGAGKVARDPAKLSRPARAYLHLTKTEYIAALEEHVKSSIWRDAKNSHNDSALVGPPVLEVSIYKKVPTAKKRADPRQGTIDQDPEFQAFLESLANPTPQNQADNADEAEETTRTKVETTPLVEDLKRKAREAAEAKKAKHSRQDSQTKGGASSSSAVRDSKKKGKEAKTEKHSKEVVNVKILKKARSEAAEAAKAVASQISAELASQSDSQGQSDSKDGLPKSRRAGIAAAARILQKDLGLSPGSAHRRARLDAAKADAESKTPGSKEKDGPSKSTERAPSSAPSSAASENGSVATKSQPPVRPKGGRGAKESSKGKEKESQSVASAAGAGPSVMPTILKKKHEKDVAPARESAEQVVDAKHAAASSSSKSSQAKGPSSGSSSKKTPAPSIKPGVLRGFVKHANPSQGVTEQLLKQALEEFGELTFIEMDRRKGFAYVDFAEHEGLVNAITSSPIQVAQGTVQVLERKDKKPAAPATAGPASSSAAPAPSGSAAAEKSAAQGGTSRRGRRGGGKIGGGQGGKDAAGAQGSSTS